MSSPQSLSMESSIVSTMMTYKENNFDFSKISDNLKCLICRSILIDPIQTECGCRYCRSCIDEFLKDGSKNCLGASEDCQIVTKYISDKAINKEISFLRVKCLYHLCTFEDCFKNMFTHLISCEYRSEKCVLCNKFYIAKDKDVHLEYECSMREIECTFCRGKFTYFEYTSIHMKIDHDKLCSKYVAVCPYQCDVKDEVNVSLHRNSCKKKPITCPFAAIGCNTVIVEEKMSDHLESEGYHHDIKLVKELTNCQKSSKELTIEVQSLTMENKHLRAQMESMKSDFDKRIMLMEKNQRQYPSGMCTPNSSVFRNGRYLWKVANFSNLKANAVKGINLTLTSDSFYSSEFGYRMCLKIYPNGDGVGKGSHLSVFFVIMKGEYDDLLSWPFRNKVTLTILEDFQKSTNFSDTFKPDARSVCYQKPEDEFNIASGSPKFLSFSDLNRFLKNDTLYIQIIVLS